jgi:carotenoid cleavage dioxygenase
MHKVFLLSISGLQSLDRFDNNEALTAHDRGSVYNVRGYEPVPLEVQHPPVRISGTLPPDLHGVYLRNNTSIQFSPTTIRLHAFAGADMVHQIQIHNGQAAYSNFYVRTPYFEIERTVGREVYVNFSDVAGAGSVALARMA